MKRSTYSIQFKLGLCFLVIAILMGLADRCFAQRHIKEIASVTIKPKMYRGSDIVYYNNEKEPFTGVYYTLYFDSTVVQSWNYLKGKRQGQSIEYFRGGEKIHFVYEYDNNKLRKKTEYFSDGTIREERNYPLK